MSKSINLKGLKDLQKKVKNAGGDVSFPDLFNPNFMTTFTYFSNIDEFFQKSPFEVKSSEDFDNINKAELNSFIKENTKFSTWEEMKTKAGELYVAKQLGL